MALLGIGTHRAQLSFFSFLFFSSPFPFFSCSVLSCLGRGGGNKERRRTSGLVLQLGWRGISPRRGAQRVADSNHRLFDRFSPHPVRNEPLSAYCAQFTIYMSYKSERPSFHSLRHPPGHHASSRSLWPPFLPCQRCSLSLSGVPSVLS